MATVILVRNPVIFDATIALFGLDPMSGKKLPIGLFFEKDDLRLYFREDADFSEAIALTTRLDRVFFADLATGIGSELLPGDVLAPNFFVVANHLGYDESKGQFQSDDLGGSPMFLECYDTQGDYDFGEFGLSVGGGVLSAPSGSTVEKPLYPKLSAEFGCDALDTWSHSLANLCAGKCEFFTILGIQETAKASIDTLKVAGFTAAILKFICETKTDSETGLVILDTQDFEDEMNEDEEDWSDNK